MAAYDIKRRKAERPLTFRLDGACGREGKGKGVIVA
jgi:hypothetical protein